LPPGKNGTPEIETTPHDMSSSEFVMTQAWCNIRFAFSAAMSNLGNLQSTIISILASR